MTTEKTNLSDQPYRAYLIRCWREGNNWRFSLETIGREPERRGFNAFQDLADHLDIMLSRHINDVSEQS